MDVHQVYARCSAGFGSAVHAVDGRWDAPTALPGWDVRELVHHLVHEQRWAPLLLDGATIEEVGGRLDGDLLGDDPLSLFDAAAAAALTAVRGVDLERTVHLSFGDRPASEYVLQLSADHLVHTWDLARALDIDSTLDPELVGTLLDWYVVDTEELYHEIAVIGPRVDVPGAGQQAQLLGRFGRDPG